MKNRPLMLVSTFLVVFRLAVPAEAQQPASSPAREAACLIRLRYPGPTAPFDCDSLKFIVNSSSVFDAAFQKVTSPPQPRGNDCYARFECTSGRLSDDVYELEGKLTVYVGKVDAAKTDEQQLLEAVLENLDSKLSNLRNDEQARIATRRKAIAERLGELTRMRDELRSVRAQLLKQSGAPISPVELEKTLITLHDKRRELELALVGQQARQDAISKAIAELSAHVQERTTHDPVVSELQQVVEIRARILERTRARTAASIASNEDVDRAVESVSLARADLARARAAAAMNAGGEQIARLNADLTQLSIDIVESRARAELLAKQTEELRNGAPMQNAVEYERRTEQLREVESGLADMSEKVARLEQQAAQLDAFTMTVIR